MSVEEPSSHAELHVHGLMLCATILVATSFPVAAAITGSLDSAVLTFIRFALATLLFAPFVAYAHQLTLPDKWDLLRYSTLSLLLVTFFWCMFVSLRLTSPLNTAAIFSINPVITSVFAVIILREKMPHAARIALPIGMFGAVWVVFRGDIDAMISLDVGVGDLIFLAGTCALAGYSTLVKVLHRGEPMANMTFWVLFTGTIWLSVLVAPKLGGVEWSQIPVSVIFGVAYLSVFTTIVTFFLFQWSTTKIGPSRVAAYTFLNPGLVLLTSIALGGPLPQSAAWPGIFLTIAALVVLQSAKRGNAAQALARPATHHVFRKG